MHVQACVYAYIPLLCWIEGKRKGVRVVLALQKFTACWGRRAWHVSANESFVKTDGSVEAGMGCRGLGDPAFGSHLSGGNTVSVWRPEPCRVLGQCLPLSSPCLDPVFPHQPTCV